MGHSQPHDQKLLTERRRRALQFGAIALLVFGVAEFLLQSGAIAPMIVRLAWAAVALIVARQLEHSNSRRHTHSLMALAIVSPAFFAALLYFRGGDLGIGFAGFMATPVIFAILMRGEVQVAISVSGSTLISGLVMMWVNDASAGALGQGSLALAASGAIAIYAARLHSKMMAAEQQLNRERLDAISLAARAEIDRRTAEQHALLGQLATGLAHEINNPLHSMQLRVALIVHSCRDDSKIAHEVKGQLEGINNSIRQIAAVITELDAILPREEPTGVCDLVRLVKSVTRSEAWQRVVINDMLPEQLPMVQATEGQVRRILEHLMYSANGERSIPPEVWIGASADATGVSFRFADNGPTPWTESQLAEDLVRSIDGQRGSSSGVAVALIRQSLRQWGGSLSIAARPGGGALTTLRFLTAEVRPVEDRSIQEMTAG